MLCVTPQKSEDLIYSVAKARSRQQLLTSVTYLNQLDAQNLFYSKFISCLYMFRAPCAHRQEVKLYYTASGIITPIGGRPVHRLRDK
jgi:hypothetical protein